MASTTYNFGTNPTLFGSIRWHRAFQASLLVGGILFLVSRGIPWVGSGVVNPAIMGREINAGNTPSGLFFLSIMALHFLVSILYGVILAPIVHGFRPLITVIVGAVVGL